MNTMAFILVLLLIGQTVAFDLSKLWIPGDIIEKGKFDILLIFVYTIVHSKHNYRYLSYKYGIGIHEWHLPLC